MYTITDAKTFIEQILQIPNWKDILRFDKLELLKLMIQQHVTTFCFENISRLSIPMENQIVIPTKDLISSSRMSKLGTCRTFNYNFKNLLESIGFECFVIAGTSIPRKGKIYEGTHVMIIVKIAHSKLYLVDVGTVLPLHEPIPLDQLPFIRKAGGFYYEFRKIGEETFARIHIGGHPCMGPFESANQEIISTKFTLSAQKIEDIDERFIPLYKDALPPVNRNIIITKYAYCQKIKDESIDTFNFKHVSIVGKNLAICTESDLIVHKFNHYDELIPSLIKYFPMINIHLFQKAAKQIESIKIKH